MKHLVFILALVIASLNTMAQWNISSDKGDEFKTTNSGISITLTFESDDFDKAVKEYVNHAIKARSDSKVAEYLVIYDKGYTLTYDGDTVLQSTRVADIRTEIISQFKEQELIWSNKGEQ